MCRKKWKCVGSREVHTADSVTPVLQTGMVTMPESYYVKVMRGSPKHQSQFKSLKGKAADGVYVNLWLTRTVGKEIQPSPRCITPTQCTPCLQQSKVRNFTHFSSFGRRLSKFCLASFIALFPAILQKTKSHLLAALKHHLCGFITESGHLKIFFMIYWLVTVRIVAMPLTQCPQLALYRTI